MQTAQRLVSLPLAHNNEGTLVRSDLRGANLLNLAIAIAFPEFAQAHFNTKTICPKVLAEGFVPAEILERMLRIQG